MKPPRVGERIEYVDKKGDTSVAKVTGRAGKSTGTYKFCFNIEKSDGQQNWIDLYRDVEKWRRIDNDNEVLVTYDHSRIKEAKLRELENWKDNKVFEEVKNSGQNTISLRWVITEKLDGNDDPILKARLVARGFEENMLEEQRRDSPTCTKDSLRLVLSIVAANSWNCNSIDIKSAFLQGNEIDREVFVKPPKEFCNGYIWKLRKNVYGLNDASRAWYFRMKEFLLSLGMKVCSVDPALFYCMHESKISGVICMHVDDIFWAGTAKFNSSVIGSIHNEFRVGSGSTGMFKYIGLQIAECETNVKMSQHDYVSTLREIPLDSKRKSSRSSFLTTNELEEFRVAVGQLIWLANQTRPDVAFEICELSTHCHNATVEDAIQANKVITKVKSQQVNLLFEKLNLSELVVECYCDASFGNLAGGGSQGSYVIFLSDTTGKRNVCSWQSRKVRRVVKSTLAAETLALLDGAEASILLANVIAEVLNLGTKKPIVRCFVDNKSLVDAVYSTKTIEDKLLRINMAVLRDHLSRRDLHDVTWVQTSCQLADALTKRGANAQPLLEAITN